MATDLLRAHPHRRYNPLTREWILVSPHRALRPWQGQVEAVAETRRPRHDPVCYLCPGNARAGGVRNPDYRSTFVFDNDFSALRPDAPPGERDTEGLLVARAERGICRVVCFSPRHDLTLSEMETAEIRRVVDLWAEQTAELGARPEIAHVQIFENRGAIMGCSNAHPHGQIWANETLPVEPSKELAAQTAHREARGRCLLCDCLRIEEAEQERLVTANAHWVALVPFWAVWPFETMLLPRRHVADLPGLSDGERTALADLLRRLLTRCDNLFGVSFPYSMGFHQRPLDGGEHPEWHLHAHVYPPLLRSATVKKFMVGYEMLAMPQRDITAEQAAERLRSLPETRRKEPEPAAGGERT